MIADALPLPIKPLGEDQPCDLFRFCIGVGKSAFERDPIYAWVSQVLKHAEPIRQRLAKKQISYTDLDKVVGAHSGRARAKRRRAHKLNALKLDDRLRRTAASRPLST